MGCADLLLFMLALPPFMAVLLPPFMVALPPIMAVLPLFMAVLSPFMVALPPFTALLRPLAAALTLFTGALLPLRDAPLPFMAALLLRCCCAIATLVSVAGIHQQRAFRMRCEVTCRHPSFAVQFASDVRILAFDSGAGNGGDLCRVSEGPIRRSKSSVREGETQLLRPALFSSLRPLLSFRPLPRMR